MPRTVVCPFREYEARLSRIETHIEILRSDTDHLQEDTIDIGGILRNLGQRPTLHCYADVDDGEVP